MEQNIRDKDLLELKFKYYAFMDLNSKSDSSRFNQIYQQAKWSILSEEIECTEQELITFASIQLQIELQTKKINNNVNCIEIFNNNNNTISIDEEEDDIDSALSKLEKTLDILNDSQSKTQTNDHKNKTIDNSVINLEQELLQMKNQNNTFKKLGLSYPFHNKTKANTFSNRMLMSTSQSVSLMSLLDPKNLNKYNSDDSQVHAANLLPVRILKKHKLKKLNNRILDAFSIVNELDLFEAKWRYIKTFQALPDYGITYFCVKVKGSKFKEVSVRV
jgi:hypothetical protein